MMEARHVEILHLEAQALGARRHAGEFEGR